MTDNPFLLPPGAAPSQPVPAGPPSASPPPTAPPVSAPPPDRFIAVPPSVESATHRLARPETAPTALTPPAPTDAVEEETRVAPTPASRGWSLVLPDGARIAVTAPVVLGRDPLVPADAPGARQVALADPGKTVSKTHVLLDAGADGLRVRDLHSTNGVAITSGGVRTVLPSGGEGVAPVGSVVELGSFTLLVDVG